MTTVPSLLLRAGQTQAGLSVDRTQLNDLASLLCATTQVGTGDPWAGTVRAPWGTVKTLELHYRPLRCVKSTLRYDKSPCGTLRAPCNATVVLLRAPSGQFLVQHVCAVQSLLRKVTKQDSLVIAEMVMKMMLTMLNSSVGKTGGVQDDAISTVGVVIQGGWGLLLWVWSSCDWH